MLVCHPRRKCYMETSRNPVKQVSNEVKLGNNFTSKCNIYKNVATVECHAVYGHILECNLHPSCP